MTENLLQRLEEKMVTLISEVEELRNQVQRLANENASLQSEKEHHGRKVQELISLLDSVTGSNLIEEARSAA